MRYFNVSIGLILPTFAVQVVILDYTRGLLYTQLVSHWGPASMGQEFCGQSIFLASGLKFRFRIQGLGRLEYDAPKDS